MRDPKLKARARQLRSEGASLDVLVENLGASVARSTLFTWVRDMPLKEGVRSAAAQAAQAAASRAVRNKHEVLRRAAYESADLKLLSDLDIRDFAVLYLAEGYRRCRNTVQICNSNPAIMKLSFKALDKLGRARDSFPKSSVRLLLYQDHVDEVELKFWACYTELDEAQINIWRPAAKQKTSKYRRAEHGIMYLNFSDTNLRARLQALMDVVQGAWE